MRILSAGKGRQVPGVANVIIDHFLEKSVRYAHLYDIIENQDLMASLTLDPGYFHIHMFQIDPRLYQQYSKDDVLQAAHDTWNQTLTEINNTPGSVILRTFLDRTTDGNIAALSVIYGILEPGQLAALRADTSNE